MEEQVTLSKEEIQYVKTLYRIDRELSKLHEWFSDKLKKIDSSENMPDDLRAQWARKWFRKVMLEKVKKHKFCLQCIPEHEFKDISDFYEQ